MNPFNPSFGRIPELFLDRKPQIQYICQELNNRNSPYHTSLIYGVRGCGKTVFMTDLGNEMSKEKDWLVSTIPVTEHMISDLISVIYMRSPLSIRKALDHMEGISFSAFGLQVKYKDAKEHMSYQTLLYEVLNILKKKNKRLLILVDEVTNIPAMREFASLYQLLVRDGYEISLIMTGLPHQVSELQKNPVLTFLLRSARIEIDPIDLNTIRYSYETTFLKAGKQLDPQTLLQMTKMTKGYAYAFQLLGYLIWNQTEGISVITDDVIRSVIPRYQLELFRNSYTKIFEDLSEKDREFLFAMAQLGNDFIKMQDINKKLHKSSGYTSVYRRRLLDAQIVRSRSYGTLTFNLPYFREYIIQTKELFYDASVY